VIAQRSRATKIVTTFGAGLACASLAPTAEGAIIDLTPSPDVVGFNTAAIVSLQGGTTGGLEIKQFNNTYGKALSAISFLNIVGLRAAPRSNIITTDQVFTDYIARSFGKNGTSTFGFITRFNQVGWVRINFGGAAKPVTYLAAAYNTTPGASMHSGTGAATVPEPTSLALLGLSALAAGSRGARRMRKSKVPER
jgi:hypothetical protein